jgi:hypothetical protein
VNFTGKATDAQGKTIAGIAGVTFSIYKDQYEGAPLWMETQNIQADAKGNYTVHLGASSSQGLPVELFIGGEARWLGVRINDGAEQPRTLLLSVPYALKAVDAETLGGKPLSAFLLAPPSGSAAAGSAQNQPQKMPPPATYSITCASSTACNKGFVPLFSSTGGAATITNSLIQQSGSTLKVAAALTATGVVTGSSFAIGTNPFAFGSYSSQNSFLGFAGNTTTTGTNNTGIGYQALHANGSGFANVANGYQALYQNTSGYVNVADGYQALSNNTTGSYNTAVGENAGDGTTTGYFNTSIGAGAGPWTGALTNTTAIGALALASVSNSLILGGTGTSAVSVGIGTSSPYYDYGLTVTTGGQNGNINGGVVVNATGGNLYLGMTNTTHKFRVDTNGVTYADGGFQSSGADFAESLTVRGKRSQYEPGDVLEIDQNANRNLALSRRPYATLVAGIYSTKPGLLASPHSIEDPAVKTSEVPLAVVGIVPCKVTSENGPIARGDLLVTSSRPGYAMRGTDRRRMLGAVVGKALEPLPKGSGVIQVLVTLQ